MKNKGKMIAPVVILVLFILVVGSYTMVYTLIPILAVRIIGGGLSLAAIGPMIAVFVQRYREIKGGEEDDLSQY